MNLIILHVQCVWGGSLQKENGDSQEAMRPQTKLLWLFTQREIVVSGQRGSSQRLAVNHGTATRKHVEESNGRAELF